MGETHDPYALTSAHVASAVGRIRPEAVDAVVMSGTGMLTLPAILASRSTIALPFLSSNICCAWWLMRAVGVTAQSPIFAASASELAALA